MAHWSMAESGRGMEKRMTKKTVFLAMGAILASGMGMAGAAGAGAAPPAARALWQQVLKLQRDRAVLPESHPFQPGSRSVDALTADLANARAARAISRAGGILKVRKYPDGSLLVKENFSASRHLNGIAAMLKQKGYDTADRNWVMATFRPDGRPVAMGRIQSCISCHAMAKQQDFVFAPPPGQLLPVSTWAAFFPRQKMNARYVALLRKFPQAEVH